jgi:hypothetical protein
MSIPYSQTAKRVGKAAITYAPEEILKKSPKLEIPVYPCCKLRLELQIRYIEKKVKVSITKGKKVSRTKLTSSSL